MIPIYIVPGTTLATNTSEIYSGTSPVLYWEVHLAGEIVASGAEGVAQGGWLVTGSAPSPTVSATSSVSVTVPNSALAVGGYSAIVPYSGSTYELDFGLTPQENYIHLLVTETGAIATLNWTAIANFADYNVYSYPSLLDANLNTNSTLLTTITPMSSPPYNQYVFNGCADSNILVFFRVSVVQVATGPEGLWSAPSAIAPTTNIPPEASGLSITTIDAMTLSYQLNWNTSANPSDFASYDVIYRKLNSDAITYTTITDNVASATSYSFTAHYGLWQYAVAIINECGVSTQLNVLFPSSVTTNIARTTPPPVPGQPIATAGNMQATITWPAVTDPDNALANYNIYVDGSMSITGTSTITSYVITGLTNGTPYTFQISSEDIWGNISTLSTASVAVTPEDNIPPPAPYLIAETGSSEIIFLWNRGSGPLVPGIAGFNVYQVTGTMMSPIYTKVNTAEEIPTEFYSYGVIPMEGFTYGDTLTYVVTALDSVPNESVYSNQAVTTPQSSIPVIDAPIIVSATGSDTQATIIMDLVSGATTYSIFVFVPGAEGTPLGQTGVYLPIASMVTITSTASAVVSGLTNGQTYTFTAYAVDTNGFYSDATLVGPVTVMDTTAPDAPTGLSGTVGNGLVNLSWTASISGSVSAYLIQQYTFSSGVYSPYSAPVWIYYPTTTATITGLTNGQVAYFAVAAYGSDDVASNYLPVPPLALTPLDTSPPPVPNRPLLTAGDGYIQVTIQPLSSPPSDLNAYLVFRTDSVDGPNLIFDIPASDVSTMVLYDSTVINGTSYTYAVAAVNDGGYQSAMSATATATPEPTVDPSSEAWSYSYQTNCARSRLLLRGEFINNGAQYYTGVVNVTNTSDSNFVDLRFGFDIVDPNTGNILTISNIDQLTISNSPTFDPICTITIATIPYSNSGVSIVTLSTSYFTNPEANPSLESGRSIDTSGDSGPNGTFLIENWPLSGQGDGNSIVYYTANVANTSNGNIATFPLVQQPNTSILWETESPTSPGTPVADDLSGLGYTNARTLWRFSGSTNSASGANSYRAAIVEILQGGLNSTAGDGSSLRTIAPTSNATTLSVTGYSYTPSSDTFTIDGSALIATNFAVNSTTGLALVTNESLSVGITATYHDIALEVLYSVPDTSTGELRLHLRAVSSTVTPPIAPHNYDSIELLLAIYPDSRSSATLQHLEGGAVLFGKSQVSQLPLWATNALLTGGSITLLLSTRGTGVPLYAEAYFTPNSGGDSLLLCSAFIPTFEGSSPWDVYGVFIADAPSGSSWQVACGEIILGGGRAIIGTNIGDADTDDETLLGYMTAGTIPLSIGGAGWTADTVTNGVWSSLTDYTLSGMESTTPSFATTNGTITLTAPVTAAGRTAIEIAANAPTFSSRARLTWTLENMSTSGEFYVAISSTPPLYPYTGSTTAIPLCVRCDVAAGYMTQPYLAPTLLIGFSANDGIYATQRLTDGALSSRILMNPWTVPTASTFVDFSIEVANIESELNSGAYVTILTLRLDGSNTGNVFTLPVLPTADRGEGWYVSFGMRSDAIDMYTASSTTATAVLDRFRVLGLPRITQDITTEDAPRTKHIAKGAYGSVINPPLWGQALLSTQSITNGWPYSSSNSLPQIFFNEIQFGVIGPILGTNAIKLIEVKMRQRELLNLSGIPQCRLYSTLTDGQLINPLTPWITAQRIVGTNLLPTGGPVPYNQRVQFDISDFPVVASNDTIIYFAVQIPELCDLAGIYCDDPCQLQYAIYTEPPLIGLPEDYSPPSALLASGLWYQMWGDYNINRDTPRDGSTLQARVTSLSHAGLISNSSSFSAPVIVDTTPPVNGMGSGVAPMILFVSQPQPRLATVNIQATDAGSGVTTFRVLRESDGGTVISTPWLPWSAFVLPDMDNATAQYTIYQYGASLSAISGAANGSFDGPRRIWAQVMDAAGNISESPLITTYAQAIAMIDTEAPTGDIAWADPLTGDVPSVTNSTNGYLRLNAEDNLSGVKDIRVKQVGSNTWTDWSLYSTYLKTSLPLTGTSYADGLARLEVQIRDWGGSSIQPSAIWDALNIGVSAGILFTSATIWQSPNDTYPCSYLGATQSQSFSGLSLNLDLTAPSGIFRYLPQSNTIGSIGRSISLQSSDITVIIVNDVIWSSWSGIGSTPSGNYYHIDPVSGCIIFDGTLPSNPVFSMSFRRDSAQLYRWDGHTLIRVANLGENAERAILSLYGTPSGLLIGGGSGNLWYSDGTNIFGPIMTAADSGTFLPITFIYGHQFNAESEPNVYIGTAVKPRLFTAPLSVVIQGDQWLSLIGTTSTFTASSGALLCAASIYDQLMFGTSLGTIITLQRESIYSTVPNLSSTWTETTLTAPEYDTDPGSVRPVSCLLPTTGEILAGISDRPEIWRYSQRRSPLPVRSTNWIKTDFNQAFLTHPSPWQFYASTPYLGVKYNTNIGQFTGFSFAQLSGLVTSTTISDPFSPQGFQEILCVGGEAAKISVLSFAKNSTWSSLIQGETSWTIEFNMMFLSGTGRQGIRITDGRYLVELLISDSALYIESGANNASVAYSNNEQTFTALSLTDTDTGIGSVSRIIYPNGQPIVIWNFPSTTGTTGSGPYYDGSSTPITGDNTQGWLAAGGVLSLDVGSKAYIAGDRSSEPNYVSFLDVMPAPTGVVRILNGAANATVSVFSEGMISTFSVPELVEPSTTPTLPIIVDSGSKLYVRARVRPPLASDLTNAKLRATWSSTNDIYLDQTQWVETLLSQEWKEAASSPYTSFMDTPAYTYVLEPSWAGTVSTIVLEWVDLPEGSNRSDIEIEFIAVVSDLAPPSFDYQLVPVRVGVNGTQVQVWLGNNPNPVINEQNFLVLPVNSDDCEIRIGKIETSEPASIWAYGSLKFIAGSVILPSTIIVSNWSRTTRIPSAGGINKLVHHLGTAYAITDGLGYFRFADNPNERATKLFGYDPNNEQWTSRGPAAPIGTDGNGLVHALDAIVYGNELIVTGQSGTVIPP